MISIITEFVNTIKNPANILVMVERLGKKELATQLIALASCVEAFRSSVMTKDRKSARQEYGRYCALTNGLRGRLLMGIDRDRNSQLIELLGKLDFIDIRILEEYFLFEDEEKEPPIWPTYVDELDEAVGTLRGTAESLQNLT